MCTDILIKGQIKSELIYEIIDCQNMTQKIWRISALRVFTVHRAEILQIFWFIFWKIDDFINPFWLNLTFKSIVWLVGQSLVILFSKWKIGEAGCFSGRNSDRKNSWLCLNEKHIYNGESNDNNIKSAISLLLFDRKIY